MSSFLKTYKKHITLTIGFLITVGALWYATRNVDFPEMWRAIKSYQLLWLIPACFGFYFGMYLRAVRWALLFRPHYHLKGTRIFPPLMICFAFNSILPGRVGEVARAYLVAKQDKTSLPMTLATVLAERMLDAITLLTMLMISIRLLPPMNPDIVYYFGTEKLDAARLQELLHHLTLLAAVMIAGAVVFVIPFTQKMILLVARHNPLLPKRFNHAIEKLVAQFAQGFHAIRDPWTLAQIVFHSIVIWLLCAMGNMAGARGLGLQMSLVQSMALMTLIGIFILIPAAPGYWGLYETGAIFSLNVMGIGRDDSQRMALALILHLIQYVPIVIWGMYYAWRLQVKPAELAEEGKAVESKSVA